VAADMPAAVVQIAVEAAEQPQYVQQRLNGVSQAPLQFVSLWPRFVCGPPRDSLRRFVSAAARSACGRARLSWRCSFFL
jgi:hypothetical protein